jgi:hypothetical protein
MQGHGLFVCTWPVLGGVRGFAIGYEPAVESFISESLYFEKGGVDALTSNGKHLLFIHPINPHVMHPSNDSQEPPDSPDASPEKLEEIQMLDFIRLELLEESARLPRLAPEAAPTGKQDDANPHDTVPPRAGLK